MRSGDKQLPAHYDPFNKLKALHDDWSEFVSKSKIRMRKKVKKGTSCHRQTRKSTMILTTLADNITIATPKITSASPLQKLRRSSTKNFWRTKSG